MLLAKVSFSPSVRRMRSDLAKSIAKEKSLGHPCILQTGATSQSSSKLLIIDLIHDVMMKQLMTELVDEAKKETTMI